MVQLLLMAHVFFGVGCLLAALWVFVEVLNVPNIATSNSNTGRIRGMSKAAAVLMWASFLAGGYWYVTFYKPDKSLILKGPLPLAHSLFMETKEHLVIMLLLLATYLPIAASNNLSANRGARQLVLGVSGLIALLALWTEGEGAMIAMGVKMALLAK